jgi:2-polyprenyl-6-methoxyphenol hydroxylase-like FAD-dependent oxidoreductase
VADVEEAGPAFSGDPRTVLIGDAAHAFSPNMAQGAALAFEDALVLAGLIAAGLGVARAVRKRAEVKV